MPSERALYSVIQYVPDGFRGEGANVGVVVFRPHDRTAATRVSHSLERPKKFFGVRSRDRQRIEQLLQAIQDRLKLSHSVFADAEDFERFIASRTDEIRLTPPRVVLTADPESEAESLYAELVGDDKVIAHSEQATVLPAPVSEVFEQLEVEGRLKRVSMIRVPTLESEFEVTAAYANGRLNYVKAVSLDRGEKGAKKVAHWGFAGRLLHTHPENGKERQLIVLSNQPEPDSKLVHRFRSALNEFNVRLVSYEESNEFAREVEREAH